MNPCPLPLLDEPHSKLVAAARLSAVQSVQLGQFVGPAANVAWVPLHVCNGHVFVTLFVLHLF